MPITIITTGLSLLVVILLVLSVRNRTKQKRMVEKLTRDLEATNNKLRELNKLKLEFLSMTTHQIRAPLTAIKGYSSMLLEGDFGILPQKATDSVRTIMKSCENLINMIEDFSNISKIEQGRMVYEKSVFDLGELVKEVVDELKPNIKKAGLSIELNIQNNSPTIVNADRGKIEQVIDNIIDNAIKYTLRGSISVSILKDVGLSAQTGKVRIVVKDSGVGIDPAEISKLFIKFSRTKDAGKINTTGTGLGLYIAKKMIEAHGGDIKVYSEGVGKGATFTIELPSNI